MSLDLSDLRAKYEAATKEGGAGASEEESLDFIDAAYAAFPELLAMAEECERRRASDPDAAIESTHAYKTLMQLRKERGE
jgi:hypothetical protein